MLLHLRLDVQVGIIHAVQIEVGSPNAGCTVEGRCNGIKQSGVPKGIGRIGTSPSAGNLPDNGLGCSMAAELFIPEGLFILLTGDLFLTIQKRNAYGFHLIPVDAVQSTGTVHHVVHRIGCTIMATGVCQFNTGFDAVGNIIVVGITRLIFQIERIQRQNRLVLHISLGRNINATTGQCQIGKGIGCAVDLCFCNGGNAAVCHKHNRWLGAFSGYCGFFCSSGSFRWLCGFGCFHRYGCFSGNGGFCGIGAVRSFCLSRKSYGYHSESQHQNQKE